MACKLNVKFTYYLASNYTCSYQAIYFYFANNFFAFYIQTTYLAYKLNV